MSGGSLYLFHNRHVGCHVPRCAVYNGFLDGLLPRILDDHVRGVAVVFAAGTFTWSGGAPTGGHTTDSRACTGVSGSIVAADGSFHYSGFWCYWYGNGFSFLAAGPVLGWAEVWVSGSSSGVPTS